MMAAAGLATGARAGEAAETAAATQLDPEAWEDLQRRLQEEQAAFATAVQGGGDAAQDVGRARRLAELTEQNVTARTCGPD